MIGNNDCQLPVVVEKTAIFSVFLSAPLVFKAFYNKRAFRLLIMLVKLQAGRPI
jgi:hypothetical protein